MPSEMKRVALYVLPVALLALGYLGWIRLSRRFAESRMEERAAGVRSAARQPPPATGTGVRITQFYASSGELSKGDSASLCYGVENARAVRLEPEVQAIEPSMNRCISVAPERTTTFRLIAQGKDAGEVSESLTVNVSPAPPRILFITLSGREVKRGEQLAMCYGVANAVSAVLGPSGMKLPPSAKYCFAWHPPGTLKYTFSAFSADGRVDRETFTVKVK